MSALSRELDRYISWFNELAERLADSVNDFNALGTYGDDGRDGWSEEQAESIAALLRERGDDCGRTVEGAIHAMDMFAKELLRIIA